MLPNYCTNITNKYGIKIGGVNTLVPNLGIKTKYILCWKNLQLYLSLRIKLFNIHGILKFKQSDWLKNTLILIQTKENMLLIVLKKTFLNWWIIALLAKQWKI